MFDHHLDLPEPGEPLDRKSLPAGGGVCALTDADGRVIQTLTAQNLRRVLGNRLEGAQQPGARPRADLRAISRRLWWQPTSSVFEASLTYLQIARRLNPNRYRKDLAFGPVWFARVNLRDRFPRWVTDKVAFDSPTVDIGPFVRRSACRRFIELLEDLFDLCRHHDVLKQAPSGQACTYKEMGQCPAPCDGSVAMEHYYQAIEASVEFSRGAPDTRLSELLEAMSAAASALQFERAARIREQVDRARKVLANDERLEKTPESFRYLVIQRGAAAGTVKSFFIDRGYVSTGETAHLRELDSVATEWTDKMLSQTDETDACSGIERSECVWLVSHYLNKQEQAPGLFLHQSELSTPGDLAQEIRRRFVKAPKHDPKRSGAVDPAGGVKLE